VSEAEPARPAASAFAPAKQGGAAGAAPKAASVQAGAGALAAKSGTADAALDAQKPDAQKEVGRLPEKPSGPRVFAKSRFVWIREYPDADMQWIGYLWTGGSVALKSERPVYGPGCEQWYAIEPKGYVCVDGKRATLDPSDPVLGAVEPFSPRIETPWPHHYGESRGVPRTTRLPSADADEAPATGVTSNTSPAPHGTNSPSELPRLSQDPFGLVSLPAAIYEGRDRLLPHSTVAYAAELTRGGKTYLLTADMTWVSKDLVTPYEKVTFQGVELGAEHALPLAFFRKKDRPQYVRTADGGFEENGQVFARLSFVELTGQPIVSGEDEYIAVKSASVFVKKSDAVIPVPQKKTPWGTMVGSNDTTGHPAAGRATWLEASVWGGWLLAYEGNKPVYATLISPGRGGTPVPGKDPLETASTPTGSFPITGKFATATMEAPGEYIHSDVPWTQNFSGPHALHGAYWHNDWGQLKSAGCVNVSPLDGRWLFGFTEPVVPTGWHGVRWLPGKSPATIFVVHR
jgi:hypothetical protein